MTAGNVLPTTHRRVCVHVICTSVHIGLGETAKKPHLPASLTGNETQTVRATSKGCRDSITNRAAAIDIVSSEQTPLCMGGGGRSLRWAWGVSPKNYSRSTRCYEYEYTHVGVCVMCMHGSLRAFVFVSALIYYCTYFHINCIETSSTCQVPQPF